MGRKRRNLSVMTLSEVDAYIDLHEEELRGLRGNRTPSGQRRRGEVADILTRARQWRDQLLGKVQAQAQRRSYSWRQSQSRRPWESAPEPRVHVTDYRPEQYFSPARQEESRLRNMVNAVPKRGARSSDRNTRPRPRQEERPWIDRTTPIVCGVKK